MANKQRLSHKPDLRADCAWLLYQVLESGRSTRDCLALIQPRHNHKDNAWIQEMAFGVLRKLPLLQQWLRSLLDKPLKGDKKVIEHLLLTGFYQLTFTRVAGHAAVSETVNAATLLGAPGLKGLVNAVLRNFSRNNIAQEQPGDALALSGLPKWLYQSIHEAYGSQADDVIEQMNQPGPVWLRVNTHCVSVSAFCHALDDAGITYHLPGEAHPDGIILTQRADVTGLPGYAKGWFAVQDGAAQLAAGYLNIGQSQRILDCCAAPGGKTAHIAQLAPDTATVVALDNSELRLKRVHENLARLDLSQRVDVRCADVLSTDDWFDDVPFDRILLDAPCSATGVIRRHPDIRWLRKKTDISQLVDIQRQMLDTVWPLLAPGGTLLYATCSLLPEENTQQIAAFLRRHPDVTLSTLCAGETTDKPGRQILPGEEQMDGFYYARLIKSEKNNKKDNAGQ